MDSKDLTSEEIVRKLIIGSPANDRMKQEIALVVNTLVGLLNQRERWFAWQKKSSGDKTYFLFDGNNFYWRVTRSTKGGEHT